MVVATEPVPVQSAQPAPAIPSTGPSTGEPDRRASGAPRPQVHFKKGATIEKDSAIALGEMILLAQRAMLEEEF